MKGNAKKVCRGEGEKTKGRPGGGKGGQEVESGREREAMTVMSGQGGQG